MSRFSVRILGFGLLGLATTVLVSWAIAIRTDWKTGPRRNFRTGNFMLAFPAPHQDTTWTFFPITEWGTLQISSGNSGPESTRSALTSLPPAERMAEPHEVPSWSVMRRGDPRRGVFDAAYLEQAFGFPMLAMVQQYRWPTKGGPAEVDGFAVPNGFRTIGRGEHVPRRLVFPGALVNSALYGWLWFSLAQFPIIVRRTMRRWRKACPGCGYDLRHANHSCCPECGLKC